MATHSSTLALKIPWVEELGAGYYPWGRKELGTAERLHFHFKSINVIGFPTFSCQFIPLKIEWKKKKKTKENLPECVACSWSFLMQLSTMWKLE